VFTFLLCLASFFDVNWLYTAKQDVHYTAILNLVLKVLLNVSLLIFIQEKSDYIYYPLITGLAQVGVGVISLVWALRRYHVRIKLPSFRDVWRILWNDKILFFHSFSHTIYTTLNIIILGLMRGPLEVGYYSAGWKLIILIQVLLISPSTVVLFPVIGEAFGRDREDGILAIRKIIPFVFLVTIVVAIGILLFGQFAVWLLYGSEFSDSITIFRMLSFMPMLLALNMIFGIQAMVNLKMDQTFFKITFFAAVMSVILNYLLIGKFGAYGAAASWLATEMFCAIAMFSTLLKNDVRLIDYKYCKPNAIRKSISLVFSKVKK
jgi:PST family polysaccharide transporter